MEEVPSTLPLGTIIRRRYVVESVLGRGSGGAVYLVRDARKNQKLFALKEMINLERKDRYRFTFDSVVLRQLVHPALPHIYTVFDTHNQERAYILMEYIDGPNLEKARLEQPAKCFPLPRAIKLMTPIVDAVIYLHSQHPPVIHRDIKLANINISGTSDETMLVDLGIAGEYAAEAAANSVHYGTSGYKAPEQYSGEISPRTDIYALGATLYTLLTGTIPANSLYRLTESGNKEHDPLVPVNQIIPTVPTPVAEAIYRAMSINSDDRFSTVDQFWQVIHANPTATQVPELAVALPAGENTGLDENPTEPSLPQLMIAPPIEENTELDAIPVAPQIPEPVVVEPEMELPTLIADPTLQREPVSVGTSSDLPPTPALPGEGKPPVGVPFQGRSPVHRTKKPGLPLPLFLCLALLVSIGLGSGLWLYIAEHHVPTTGIPASRGQFKATPPAKVTATEVPVSKPYPNVVRPYSGTIHDIPDNLTTKMSLTGIQQHQGNIHGHFTGLLKNSSFNGTVDTAGHIHFTVVGSTGQSAISFDGAIQAGGNLVGSYCSPIQSRQCSNYGLWSLTPGSSKQSP